MIDLILATADKTDKAPGEIIQEATMEFCERRKEAAMGKIDDLIKKFEDGFEIGDDETEALIKAVKKLEAETVRLKAKIEIAGRNVSRIVGESIRSTSVVKKCACAISGEPKCCRECLTPCEHQHAGECIWEDGHGNSD